MTSSTIDLQHAISTLTLLASRDIDNNVFNESHPHSRPLGRHAGSHPPLQSSLSVPLESYYQADTTGCGVGDSAFLTARLPAPKLAERRTQSIGDSSTVLQYQGVGLQEMTAAKQGATTVPGPARYKTELCRPYEENGTCRYGSKCQFAHGKTELRSVVRHPKYKTDLCRTFHTTGLCPYGPRCHFIHNDDERRTSDSSSGDQQLRQLAAVRRSTSSIQQGLEEERPRLQRQYSEYRPRTDTGTPASGNPRPGPDLQRRASSVADAVIRRSIGYQHQLQTLAEADQQHPSGLKVNTVIRSVGGSAADSFSSASSVTDSPSPSPTAGLLLSPAVDDPVATTPPVRHQVPASPAGWSPESPDHARAALLAELVSRLGPHDIAAALIRALQLPGNATAASAGALLPRGFDDGKDADSSMRQMQSDIWTQYQQQQQQQQRAPGTSNVCW